MSMAESYTKICRICLTEGSRNIFQRTLAKDALYNVSSLNRISEKLRYVTLLKIDEMENLPPMICDLCIVQLNVAYNFKRQATESDTKLRQYLIENGIDIMKDPLAIPSNSPARAPNDTSSSNNTVRAITSSRTIHRINSTASSSVQEVPAGFQGRLQPIRIKVETPETTEQSSEGGDLLSNPTVSPLSTATSATIPTVGNSNCSVNNEQILVDSSPASSKGTCAQNGRDSAMVMVDSRNVSMHGDDDYVQNILGSNSSIATSVSKVLDSDAGKKNIPAKEAQPQKDDEVQRKLKCLMSTLAINMVTNARFPNSKLRIKARKKLQKEKAARLKASSAKTAAKRARSMDGDEPVAEDKSSPIKLEVSDSGSDLKRSRVIKKNPNLISPNKLRSLREKIREEKNRQNDSEGENSKRRHKITTLDLTTADQARASKIRGSKLRFSIS